MTAPDDGQSVVFRAKWRSATAGGLFAHPHHSIAAYHIQDLFLDPDEYVVPPTTGRCILLSEYRRFIDPAGVPTYRGTACVFGELSYWLENVQGLEDAREEGWLKASRGSILDPHLFSESPSYRRSAASTNLLTYLISHSDAHIRQFMITKPPQPPFLYVVDNSTAFLTPKNPSLWFSMDWSKIHVPAVPKRAIERLRQVDQRDFDRLGAVEVYRREGSQLELSADPEPVGVASGLTWDGTTLTVGLTQAELQQLRRRLKRLLSAVEQRRLDTF